MLDKNTIPNDNTLKEWIGAENQYRWTDIVQFIESNYPGVFSQDWLFGGKKHGWSLRFKKNQSFCTLIPEKDRLLVVIVLGRKEREKTESILSELHPQICDLYDKSKTYHDGKWLAIDFDSDDLLPSIKRLLEIKRRAKQI